MNKTKLFKPVRHSAKSKFELESNKKETGRSKGYDAEWEKYRWRFLYHNPRCYACGRSKEDRVTMCVDHILAHKGDQVKFWDPKNFMPLCSHCHSVVTARFDKFEVPRIKEKMVWIDKTRELNRINIKVKVVPFKRGSGKGKA